MKAKTNDKDIEYVISFSLQIFIKVEGVYVLSWVVRFASELKRGIDVLVNNTNNNYKCFGFKQSTDKWICYMIPYYYLSSFLLIAMHYLFSISHWFIFYIWNLIIMSVNNWMVEEGLLKLEILIVISHILQLMYLSCVWKLNVCNLIPNNKYKYISQKHMSNMG